MYRRLGAPPALAAWFLRHPLAPPVLVVAVGLLCTLAASLQLHEAIRSTDVQRFTFAAERKLDAIRGRVQEHITMLRGAAGLFAAKDDVTRADFREYVERLLIRERSPGVQGIGFSRRVDAADLDSLTIRESDATVPDFRIKPPDPRPEYHAIVYLEPLDARNRAAIGFDMFTEPTRRAAMERARDSGRSAASGKVELVQEIDQEKQAGFLIYVPVYQGGQVPESLAERRTRLQGFTYSPYRAADLFRALFQSERDPELAFAVFDAEPRPENLLFASADGAAVREPRFTTEMPMEVASRTWVVRFSSQPAFERGSGRELVPFVLGGGFLATLLLAGLAFAQVRATEAAVSAREELRALNAHLEERVVERTRSLEETQKELNRVNAGLEATVAERTAELRESNEEIQRFAYIVSHDLRSPLVNIMGFTSELEALRDEALARLKRLRADAPPAGDGADDATLAEDFDEALGFIKTSISKMDRLIQAILGLSRQGRRDFSPEPIDMTALLSGIAASMTHQAEQTGASITIGSLPAVTSDRLALEQVFSNLLDNALKYLRPDEPGRIEVQGRTAAGRVVYEVRDNGRGIDKKDRERVFELFRRAGVQDQPGEGIGLANVRALVRRLGGTIRLDSQPGRGSTFTVTLPEAWSESERKAA